jgi:predicted alpha/beta-fold hydrolase
MNRLPRFYHHGDTADLEAVIEHAQKRNYTKIALIGFSMGGSMVLKYLGEQSSNLSSSLLGAVTFSVPCHLGSSAAELDKSSKSFYRNRFLKKLGKKIASKAILFPTQVSFTGFEKINSFREFDNRYTAPLHHFKDADDFYQKASAEKYLAKIELPSLLVNAENDPFLPRECYPVDICKRHPHLSLEIPKKGGHVGFTLANASHNWMEFRAYEFLTNLK